MRLNNSQISARKEESERSSQQQVLRMGPLRGLKVLEFAGLAPVPFCGMVLADFGATITRIDRTPQNPLDPLQAGKRTIALNMKDVKAQSLLRRMCRQYDVLLEGYRPGVMERLGLGPEVMLKENPSLVYARLSGFGQTGPLKDRAGHDINYLAMSGLLSMFGRRGEKPTPPINLAADFAGGGLVCAFGILAALLSRASTGQGQVVDCSMTEGAAYVGSWLSRSRKMPIWSTEKRGENLLDGGAFFYDTYETKDGEFMSVGCLEPQFFAVLVDRLQLDATTFTQFMDNEEGKRILEEKFRAKTQKEWSEIFEDTDACVYPVLDWRTVGDHRLHRERGNFIVDDGLVVAAPAPKLSETACESAVKGDIKRGADPMTDAVDILKEVGLAEEEIRELAEEKVVIMVGKLKL